MFDSISRGEWKFLGIIWIVAMAVAFFPIVMGYFMTPANSIFLFRPSLSYNDYPVYFSQIEQVKHGMYLFKELFTQEPEKTGVLSPFWLAVGIFANIFSVPSMIALQMAKFFLIPVFLLSAYCLSCYFFEEEIKRKTCFILFIFVSGIGWWFSILSPPNAGFPSVQTGEAFTLTILTGPSHFIASLTLLILIFLFSFCAFEKGKFIYSIWAGCCALLLFSFHPYHIYTVFGVTAAFLLVELLMDKKLDLKHIAHCLIIFLFSLPPVIYYLWVFFNIPIFRQTMFMQNITLSPPIWIILADYSLLLIFAVFGMASFIKDGKMGKKNVFLAVWIITQFFLLYIPVNTQRRLLEGLNIPIMILATQGLFFLKARLENRPWYGKWRFHIKWFLIWVFFGSILFAAANNFFFFKDTGLAYLRKDENNAMIWIEKNTSPDSVIFSGEISGNIIPAIAFRHVYYGQWSETVDSFVKYKKMSDFFAAYNDEEKKEFLEQNHIGYLFWGSKEKEVSHNFSPDNKHFLQKVYVDGGAVVYKVN